MVDIKEYITIERLLCPFEKDSKRQLIYKGSPIEIKKIPEALKFGEDARKYLYTITHVSLKEKRLRISNKVFDYEDILNNGEIPGKRCFVGEVEMPFDDSISDELWRLLIRY